MKYKAYQWIKSTWLNKVKNKYPISNIDIRSLMNTSFLTSLFLIGLYILVIIPLKIDIEKMEENIIDLQSDIIEVRTIFESKENTTTSKYFSLPKGTALTGLIKTTLENFQLRHSGINVKEGSEFTISLELQDVDYQTFKIWLNFMRKNYALIPSEIDIKKSHPPTSEKGANENMKDQNDSTLKIALKLKGSRF